MKKNVRNFFLWIGMLVIFLAWVFISWRRWPDCIIDCGRELYLPWQISQGKVLYKDLFYYYGPLAQYVHAFIFKLFGTSLWILITTNFILLLVTGGLLYFLFDFLSGSFAGYMAVYIFLGIFAFGHYTEIEGYTFICPYSNELTYGFTLSLAGLLCVGRWLAQPKTLFLGMTGLFMGLVFLTKIEVLVAFGLSSILALILNMFHEKPSLLTVARRAGVIILSAAIVPGAYFLYLLQHLPVLEAIHVIFQPWTAIKSIGAIYDNFFKATSGLDHPSKNLLILFQSAGRYVCAAFCVAVLSAGLTRVKNKTIQIFFIIFWGIWIGLMAMGMPIKDYCIERGVPIALLIFICIKFYQFFKGHPWGHTSKVIFEITLSVYCFVLMLKILLNVFPGHYGFVLALPGAVFLGILFTNYIPCWGRTIFSPKIFRLVSALLIVGIIIFYFRFCQTVYYQHMNYQVSHGGDNFLAKDPDINQRPVLVNYIVDWMIKNTSPRDTLVVMPQGVMINYLSRRSSSIPLFEFTRGSVTMFGEQRAMDLLAQNPPSYVLMLSESDDGQKFGHDYGVHIYQWVRENYENLIVVYGQSSAKGPLEVPLILMQKRALN